MGIKTFICLLWHNNVIYKHLSCNGGRVNSLIEAKYKDQLTES